MQELLPESLWWFVGHAKHFAHRVLTSDMWNGVDAAGSALALLAVFYAARALRLESHPRLFARRGSDGTTMCVFNAGQGPATHVLLLDHELNIVDDTVDVLPPMSEATLLGASRMHQSVLAPAYFVHGDIRGCRPHTKLVFTALKAEGAIHSQHREPRLRNLRLRLSRLSFAADSHLRRRLSTGLEDVLRASSWWRWTHWRLRLRLWAIRGASRALRAAYTWPTAALQRRFAPLLDAAPSGGFGTEITAVATGIEGWHFCWHTQYEARLQASRVDEQGNVALTYRLVNGHQEQSQATIILTTATSNALTSMTEARTNRGASVDTQIRPLSDTPKPAIS